MFSFRILRILKIMKYTKLYVLICVLFVSVWGIAQTAAYDPSVFIDININSGNPAYPFPQFLEYKGGGKSLAKYNAEGVTHADMEKTLREAYEIMMHRCRYEGKYCGVDYISFNRDDVAGNYGTFVSEGDGYALLAAAIFADQKTFNGLYMWIHDIRFSGVKRFRDGGTRGLNANDYAGPYLAAWKDKTFNAAYGSDSHSATDGDVDIAMAMLIAYKQWGEWMMQDGAVVKDNAGNPISLKYETQRVVGALVDTLGQWDKGSGALTGELSGVVGIDGYEKRGNSWGELTRWRFTDAANAQYPGVNGPYNVGPNLLSIYGGNYIDYDAPSYFEEFWRWLKNGDGVDSNNENLAPWEIHQFKRAAASGNWLNQQAYNQGYYASIGNVSMNTDGSPTFGVYVDGEDFRYCWRHVLDYLWHGDADYDWNPTTHQVIEGQTNNSERLMGIRHAALLKNPSNSGTQLCSKMGASPDPGQPLWFGVSQIPQQWRLDGGITSAYHTNYSVGAGATAAVASEDLELLADIYRQCEIMWDGNNTAAKLDPEERYIGSTPKYFHGWFRTLGMLVCSGNLQAPEDMKPAANMKVYMSVDKTYAYEGDKVAYTVQYRNYGSLDAQNVKIQTPLDEDYTFVSATKGGVYDPATHTITWNIGTVKGFKSGGLAATQDSVAFTVKITSLANSRVCETSTISGSNFDEWISNEYPNHATYTMERNCVDVLANRSLILEKTANRTELNPNDKVTFTVNFENVSSDDSWMNGGRDNVRISYGNYYMKGNAYQFYHLYRFWNDSYEAYINMNNYRVSYFMYDAAAQGLYDATTNPTGWTFVVDNQNDLDKYGYNPATGPITFTYQKIPQGEDEYGKWNQRLMIRFADVLMAPSTHVYDKLDSQYLLHKGVWGPGFIRARLASNPNSDLTTRVQDDWSFSTDITAGTIDGQGETFTLITPCWANYENLGYEIDNYSRHTCSSPTSKLKNFDRVLVEEFDGYTWRRIQGRGPLPGKEAYHVTIVDTIPKELTFDAFVTKKALGIDATYTAAPAGASYSGIVKWTIPEMLVGESGKLVYTCVAKDLGCPNVEDTYYINAAWIYSDTDSPDSSSVELMTTCSDLPPYIEPQDALFKTASVTTASVGDEISYELKYVNTKGTIVDDDCSSTTNWMTLGNGSMSTVSNGALKLSGSYFFGPKYSYGKDGAVYLSFTGKPYATQNLYFVMRYESGTPGNSNFKGVCMKLLINIDGNHNFGYELYNNGTLLKKEGSGWADAIQYSGDAENPVFKFVLNGDHLYMYINDAENDWTSVVKDWSGLTTSPGYFGMYVNSNGNNQTALNNFRSELDYGFDIQLSDELPSELTNITNISGSGTYSAGTNKITWPMVSGPIAPNDEVSYTFDATVHACNSYINNYGVAKVYGQDEIRVVNSVKCGASVCPDAPETEDVSVCVGEVKNLSATGETNAKYTWYSSATGTETVSPKFTATEVGTFDFYVSQTVGGCESARTKLTVTVTQPEKPVVSNVSLCKNQTSVDELTATGSSLKWYNGSDVELSAAPVPDVSIEGDVSYFVTQTVDGCESEKAEITVSVGALPKPTTENVTYCLGEEVSALTATATESLQWYETETGGTASTQIIPLTSSVGTTTYYVSQTTGECESERASLVVTVKPNPVATISATAEGYCGEASDVKLSLESEVALTTATFKWLNGTAVAGTSSTIVNAEAGTYTCTLELDGCEYTTESKTIVKSENPTYTITGAGSYCPESESKTPVVITFTAGKAPFTFTENVTGANTSTENTFTITNPSGGVYKLTSLTDDNGCEMTATAASVEVVDLETPDLSIVSIPSVCAGSDAVDVSNYVTAGTGTLSYETDKGTITAAGVLSDLTTAGEYTVTVKLKGTTSPYCVNTQTAIVTVAENPSVSLAATYTVCSESDLELTPTNNGTSTYSYAWAGDGATKLNSISLDNPTFNAEVTADTDYTLELTVTDRANSCTSTVFTTITTYALPTVTLSAEKDYICSDEELDVKANVNSSNADKYYFSVGPTQKAKFAPGNLQYQASTNTWRFADEQFTIIEQGNANKSATYDGWVDLFGWGTSGWSGSGANKYQPYDLGGGNNDYYLGGSAGNNMTGDYANADWGIYNAISNGGNKAGLWRTPTMAEWEYLRSGRPNADNLVAAASVNNVNGVIILPDNWELPSGITFNPGFSSGNGSEYFKTINEYTYDEWKKMEANGALFLPTSCTLAGTTVQYINEDGSYWSSTTSGASACYFGLRSNKTSFIYQYNRGYGRGVRLLKEVATGNGDGIGDWTNATKVTDTTATIDGSANAAGPLTVSYVYTDGHSCKSKESTKDFTIVAKPDKPQVTTISYCLNAEVTTPLTLNGVTNPLWYGTTGTDTPSATGPIPSTASVGTTKYYVSQVVDGCESEQAELSVVVKDKLTPEIVLSETSVCEGTKIDVSLAQNFDSQTWTGTATNFMNSTSMAAPTFLATATPATYTLQVDVVDGSGCTGTSEEITIIVNPIPVVSLSTAKAGNCISETTAQTITATIEPSDLNGTFQWTNVTDESKTSASFVPSSHSAGDYEVTYQFTSDANCASNVATLTMSVYALPEITITPSKTDVCASGEYSADVTMTPSLTTGTFEYSVDNGTIGTDGTLPTSNGAGTYTITLMYTDGNSCQKTAETIVTIHELPDVKFASTNPTEICYNTSAVTLAVEPATTTAANFKFVGTSGASSAEFNPATAAVGQNAITYTYTDAFGCQNSATHNLEVVKVLAPTVDAPNPKTVTIDDFGVLLDVTTMTATANVATDELIWQDEARTQLETGNSYESPETTEGQYSYFVKEYRTINGKACYSDSTLATLVLSNCSAKSPIAESKKLCVGDDGAITLTATNAGGSKKLSWFSDRELTSILQDDSDTYATTVATTSAAVFTYYAAEYDADKDCWSVPTPVTVTVNDLPQVSINQIDYLCYGDGTYTATGTINSIVSTAGTWSVVGDEITVDAQSGVLDLTSAGKMDGTYTLQYTYVDDNNCTFTASEEFNVEYPNQPSSNGWLGIVSKPIEVELAADDNSLEASYSEVRWYAANSNTPVTGNTWKTGDDPATEHTSTYYLTQVVNGCESERATTTVQIVSCPFAKPDVVSAVACKNATSLDDLTASLPTTTTVPADKWIWYDANKTELTAGTASTYTSGVSTATAGATTFYVGYLATEPTTQEQCPSPLTEVTVTINELPSVTITPVDNAICYELGDYQMSATVNGTMTTAGDWSVENNAAVVSSYGIFNSKQNGQVDASYNVRYTYTDQNTNCSNYDELTVTVEYPEIPSANDYAGLTSQPDPVILSAQFLELLGTANWYANGVVASNSTQWTTDDNPSQAHTSNYNLSQTVQGCESEKVPVTVTINDCPFMAPVATGTEICQDGTNLSDISASLPSSTTVSADSWIWYDGDKNELTRGTANSFATGVSTATSKTYTFYVSYLATDVLSHIQCESAKAEVTVVVNPLPEITFDQSNKQLVCYDGGDVAWKTSVDYHSNGVGSGSWAVDGTENNGITSAGVFNPTAFGEQTGTYEISYTYTDGKSCVNTAKQNIKVQFTLAPEVSDFAALTEQNKTVVVSATPISNDAEITWYDANNAKKSNNTVFETGDNGTMVTHKSYFATQTINTCESKKSEAKVDIIDCPVPKPVIVSPEPICNYDVVPELQASLGDWAERPTGSGSIVFNFYDEENATTPISSDLEGTFTPNIDKTKAATYTFWVAEYDENVVPAACEGKRAKVTLNVVKTSEPKISLSLDAICQYEDNPTLRGIGENIQWYENEPTYPAENPDGDGTSYIPSFDQVGNHTVWMTQTVDGCLSEAVSASYEIKPIPNKPQTQDASVCETNNNAAVRATADNGGFITWYMNIDATGMLVKSSDYSPSVANPGTYTYYATQTVDGCESQTEIATYTIKPLPKVPVIETNSVSCDYDTEHILSVASKENVEVVWYSSMDTTSFLATGNVYTHTVTSSGMQRYFARQRENGCLGNYAMAAFNIVESPAKPMVKNDVVCYASTANLSSDGLKDSWYSDEELTSLESIGNSLQIDNVTDDIVYYVVRERNGCMSPIAEAAIHVIAAPKVSILVDEEELPVLKRCEYDEEKTLETLLSPEMGEDDYVEWHIFPGNKTIQTTGSLRMSDYVTLSSPNTESTNYTVRAQYMVKNASADEYCKSDADTIKIITNAKARTPIVLSKVICQGEEIEPLFAFGSPNITWMSIDGILPLISQGTRYTFATKQGDIPVGSYHFIVFDENTETGCHSDSTTVEMILAPAAQTKIYGADSVCIGATEEYFTTFDSRSTYMWSVTGGNSNYSKDATATSVRYVDWMNQGIDTLVVFEQTWAGCQGSDTMIVKIANTPKAMFTWSLPGESNVIELVDSTVQDSICDITPSGERIAEEVPYTLYWNYGHQGELEDVVDLEVPYEKRRFPIREDSYVYGYNCPILTVENSYGCKDVYNECIFINITSGLFVPTAFAPTNPAHDVRYFQPKGYNLKTCEVSVYDKWGNLLWFSNEVEDGMFVGRWDGTYDGKKLASDTYIWKIEATFMDGQIWEGYPLKNGKKTKYGNVVLIR